MVITSLKIAKGISEQISGKWWRARVNDRDFFRKEEVILCLQYSEDDMDIYEVFVKLYNAEFVLVVLIIVRIDCCF